MSSYGGGGKRGERWCHPEKEGGEGWSHYGWKRERGGGVVSFWAGAIVSECSFTCSAVSFAV